MEPTMSKPHAMLKLSILLALALLTTGCDSQMLVAGNVFFLGVTCVMLWSTINLGSKD
jgi:hypothetical protein